MARCLFCGILLLVLAAASRADTIREIVRFENQGVSKLRGIGIVTGLAQTGDSGKELAVAVQLASLYQNSGIPVGLKDIAKARTAAVVAITCTIPKEGARVNDEFDVTITAMHSATSLKGGQLLIAPLQGIYPGDPVYAFAEGEIVLDDPEHPTRGTIRLGAHMRQDIRMAPLGDSFNLLVKPAFAGGAAASAIAATINSNYFGGLKGTQAPLATAVDDRTIRIEIPEAERPDGQWFVNQILAYPIEAVSLKLPARVIVNQASGTIVLTSNVHISPTAIIDKDLTIISTQPPPVPSPLNPLEERSNASSLATDATPGEQVRLQDVLNAFKQLNVPVGKQIQILEMLSGMGQLHAELVLD
jgi:flagellar P-ring protein precursor FlgI